MAEEAAESTDPQNTEQSESAELGDAGKKALADERKARRTAEQQAKELKSRLDELEAAQLSREEKATKRAEEAEKRAAASDTTALKWRTAVRHGISDEDADLFLTGADEETLTRQAEALTRRVQEAATAKPPKPTVGLRSGASTTDQRMDGKEQTAAAIRSFWGSKH